jgi:hypothetical protein
VDIPTLILIGEDDPGMHRPHMEALGNQLPCGTVAGWPQFDHFCHIRRPLEVARAIENLAAVNVGPHPHHQGQ